MRDFDSEIRTLPEDERTFKLKGETFVLRAAVKPEVLFDVARVEEEGAVNMLPIVDKCMMALIDGDGPARYEALRAREQDPLTVDVLMALLKWAVEVMSGRPTLPQ